MGSNIIWQFWTICTSYLSLVKWPKLIAINLINILFYFIIVFTHQLLYGNVGGPQSRYERCGDNRRLWPALNRTQTALRLARSLVSIPSSCRLIDKFLLM